MTEAVSTAACTVGTCGVCIGFAWSLASDSEVPCACPCHDGDQVHGEHPPFLALAEVPC